MTERQPIWSQLIPETELALEERDWFVACLDEELHNERYDSEMVRWLATKQGRDLLRGFLEQAAEEYEGNFVEDPEEEREQEEQIAAIRHVTYRDAPTLINDDDLENLFALFVEEAQNVGCSMDVIRWLGREARERSATRTFLHQVKQSYNESRGLSQENINKNNEFILEQAVQYLGRENVHGPDDVARLLGFMPKEIPSIPYTLEDFQKTQEMKKAGVEEMLVLFVHDEDGTPLTLERLNVLIQKTYDERGIGKFLYPGSSSWYKDEEFFTQLGLKLEWKLVTKTCIPDSYSKRHHTEAGDGYTQEATQEYAIEKFAKQVGIPREEFNRLTPAEALYAGALHLVVTDERLLEMKYHWSDVKTSDGYLVFVGSADRGGADVGRDSRDNSYDDLGVCLSR